MARQKSKVLALALVFLLLAGLLAACGGNASSQSAPAAASSGSTPAPASSGAASEPEQAGARREVVTMAMTSATDTLNPLNVSGNYGDIIFDQVFDRLVSVTMEGEYLPRLAESWEISEDYTVATFHLFDNIKWHDGEPFTAHDMVFTGQLSTNPDLVTNRRNYYASIVGTDDSGVCENPDELGIKAVDDYTLEITFKKPTDINAFIAMDNMRIYALPKHLLENADVANLDADPYFQNPIGTGAFKFESQVSGERYELVANMDYHQGAPSFDRLVIRVMDAASIVPGLMSGEVDITSHLGEIPLDDWTSLSGIENIVPAGTKSFGYQYMTINCSKEYFQDERVRRAISMAINRQAIVDQLLFGEGVIAYGPLPDFHPYFNKEIENDLYDPEGAKQILEEAGWDFDRELEFFVPTGNKVRENSATLIQQDLAAIGVKTKLQTMDFTTEINSLRESKGDFGLLGGAGSVDPDDARILLDVGTNMNFSHYPNADLFDLATDARNQPSRELRQPLYDQLQEELIEKMPYCWLYFANQRMAHNNTFASVPIEDFPNLEYRAYTWTFNS